MSTHRTITLEDIRGAGAAIAGIALRTPLIPAYALSERFGAEILLKLETLQPTGAFKLRGAPNAVANLPQEVRSRGVACSSTGNHGRAVAHAARSAGIRAVVCLSRLVPEVKVRAIEALGAEVRRVGQSQDDAQLEVDRLVAEEGLTDIPPFDHPHVIAGQATIGLELLEDAPDLTTIVVPLSGGGLAGGIALAAKAVKPGLRIVGVTMEDGPAMYESIRAGRPVEVTEVPSLADSLGGGIGLRNRWTYPLCRDLVDETLLVGETEIYRGMRCLFRDERIVAEGGSAVGVAALLAGKLKLGGKTALIISGRGVDMDRFTAIAAGQPVQIGDRIVEG